MSVSYLLQPNNLEILANSFTNINNSNYQMFLGLEFFEDVLFSSTPGVIISNNSNPGGDAYRTYNNLSGNKVNGYIFCNISNLPFRTLVNKGVQYTGFTVIYSIQNINLNVGICIANLNSYIDNTAVSNTSIPLNSVILNTNTLPFNNTYAQQFFFRNPFFITNNQQLNINLIITIPNNGLFLFWGIFLNFNYTIL